MKILFCGDVVGRSGREAVTRYIPKLRNKLALDAVVVNGENAAAGFGITADICKEFYKAGVDVITTGNHIWDQREMLTYISGDCRLIRPLNYPHAAPGRGSVEFVLPGGERLLVINVMGRLFMDALDDPFSALSSCLQHVMLGDTHQAIMVDVHAEATSEKMALAHFLDGRVSLVVGSHTHVPTADHQILPSGTAYLTDAGMCGDYLSVVGMDKEIASSRFITKLPNRLRAADGEASLCGVVVNVSRETGRATHIEPLRIGGHLASTHSL